jgi:hypothetical protein
LPFVKEFVHIFSRRMDNTSKTLQTEEPHGPSRHHQCEEHLVTAILLIDETTTVEKAVCTVRPALTIFFPRRHIQTTRGLTKGKNVISACEEQPSAQLIVGNGFQISPR